MVHGQELTGAGRDGRRINLLVSFRRIAYQGQDCLLAAFMDISQRRRAEEDLKSS